MLLEWRSSMLKIKNLFRQRPSASRRGDSPAGENGQQRWSYSISLNQKMQQIERCSCPPALYDTYHVPLLPVEAVKERWLPVLNDMFVSLDVSESPTSPFGIKAFKHSKSQSLSEYTEDVPCDTYKVESLSKADEWEVQDLINQVNAGFLFSAPKLSSLGTGGVYFLSSEDGEIIAVFKPTDEEPKGINNPKGYKQSETNGETSLRKGITSGEGAIRERAAFLLDHESLSGVPATAMVRLTSSDSNLEKIGSLQRYVPHDYDAEECGSGLFSVHDVHKICLADLRFINTDRNGQNILISRNKDGTTNLTPIDHGYCFPDTLTDLDFEWTYWPQAKQPFGPNFVRFIEEMDPEADLEILQHNDVNLRPECQRIFLFVNYFVKWAVRRSCTPRDIANVLSDSERLNQTLQRALERSYGTLSELQVYKALDLDSDALLAKIR